MARLFKLAVLAGVLGIGGVFLYTKSGGIPEGWRANPLVHSVLAKAESIAPAEVKQLVASSVHHDLDTDKLKIYKWKDAKGVVHYDNHPVDGAEVLAINPDANVLPALEVPEDTPAKSSTLNEDLRALQEAKKAHFEALTQ